MLKLSRQKTFLLVTLSHVIDDQEVTANCSSVLTSLQALTMTQLCNRYQKNDTIVKHQ